MMNALQRFVTRMPVLLVMVVSFAVHATEDRDIRLVTGDSFPPFSDRAFEGGGIITQVVRQSFEMAGYENVEVIWRSWPKGFEMTSEGQVAGSFPYAFTRARGKSVLFSDPIMNLTAYGWYARKYEWFEDNLDLVGKTLCLPLGYAELGNTGRMFSTGQAIRLSAPDMKTCFKLLAAGRVDSVVSPIPEALASIAAAELPVEDFDHVEEGLSDMPLHFIVGKNHPEAEEILAEFNNGLALMRQDGALAEILAQVEY